MPSKADRNRRKAKDPVTGEYKIDPTKPWTRAKVGRPPRFEGPEDLWKECVGYFEWASSTPLKEQKVFHNQGAIVKTDVEKVRAFTHTGLLIYLNISKGQWSLWKSGGERDDLIPVMEMAEQIIYDQKFTHAAADMLNANIISRELGLADSVKHDGGMIVKIDRDDSEL